MRFLKARAVRKPQTWWRAGAVVSIAAAVLAARSGDGAAGAVLVNWAVVCLYASVDHVVEPVLAELVAAPPDATLGALCDGAVDGDRPPAELSARQRRVLRLLAYGLEDEEIAELVDLDEPTVDVAVILAHLGAEDRAEAVEIVRRTGIVAAAGPRERGARPAA